MGITIPEKHKIIKADSDPFGPPGDQQFTYIFQFDSVEFKKLVNGIKNSPLFNIASAREFSNIAQAQKFDIIKTLSNNKMLAFWVKTDSSYNYNGDEFFLNDKDKILVKAALKNVYLPNYDTADFFSDGYTPRIIYYVNATVDIEKRTLYYNYVHP